MKDLEEIPFFIKKGKDKIFCIFGKGKKNYPLLIFVHGWSGHHLGTHNRFFVIASRYFQRKGFSTLRFDFRGCGNSTMKFEDQTITTQIEDLKEIISYAKKTLGFKKLILFIQK